MGRIKELSRKSVHTRKRNPVVYLICEGSETEIRYFKRFRSRGCNIIILRTTKTEKNRIYEKMLGMGIRSLSAYIRKMALDGYCLNLDLPQLRRMAYLLQMCSNNLNQYAKAANENGRVYAADLEDLRIRLDELISIGKQILAKLTEL